MKGIYIAAGIIVFLALVLQFGIVTFGNDASLFNAIIQAKTDLAS